MGQSGAHQDLTPVLPADPKAWESRAGDEDANLVHPALMDHFFVPNPRVNFLEWDIKLLGTTGN